METPATQIFQTSNPSRWQRFKWGGRIILFLLLVCGVVVFFALRNVYMPSVPQLKDQNDLLKNVLLDNNAPYKESKLSKEYKGFRSFIKDKWLKGKGCGQSSVPDLSRTNLFSDSLGIRAGFFVAWDPQSFYSLEKNISKLNLVLPECFFLDPKADTLIPQMDNRVKSVLQKSGIKVVPLLTNYIFDRFRGDVVHRILHDEKKKTRLINDIIKYLEQNKFHGVNVDFEELQEQTNEPLTNFQKDLYTALHAKGFLVTQSVQPFNEDYDYASLAQYNDYLFLMAYDEFSGDSKPGPVSSQKWIEAAVDHITKVIPSEKVILCIAGYGYNWAKGRKGTPVSYQEALSLAKQFNAPVDFDNDTYNLKFSYVDENNVPHTVYCTDAATNFNTLRFATEDGLAGTALWRLGSEDNRLWDFYDQPMDKRTLRKFNFTDFTKVEGTNDFDYIGEGEILDVVARPTDGHISSEMDTANMLISEERYDSLPSTFVIQRWGKAEGKKLVLTFDDGPDPVYTRKILDTLAKYRVPAAFFLVGQQAESNIPLVKRIYNEGHEIGNHTFSHPNIAKVSEQRAFLEMDATRLLIECITGHSTIMFRAPYNADSEPETMEEMIPVALSRTKNYLNIGESIDPDDWEATINPDYNADTLFNRVVRRQKKTEGSIILLHDAGGPREATVDALPRIIQYYRAQGYTFVSVGSLLGKTRDELMPPIPKGSGYYILQINYYLVLLGYYGGHFLFTLFLAFLILSMLRLGFILVLTILQKRKEKKNQKEDLDGHPLVSIIVPAFNEEVNAVASMNNLLRCDYDNFEVIFVDDGSTDTTYDKVHEAFKDHPKVKVFTKPNGGKASALNYGIAQSHADFVVCIDADTKLLPDAVRLLLSNFADPNVGAVAGTVKVGNEVNVLTRWQSIEYITSQNFDRKAFAYLNAITVVPGAIGGFRKDALILAGGFTVDTLAEDCDLTIRILRSGYTVANEARALALTEAPETVKQFLKQRFRWSFGVMQTFWKNRDALFNPKYGSLGWIALPDMLLFKYFIPFFTPVGDVLMLIGLITGNATKIGGYYLIFLLIDAAIALIAFIMEKEKPWKIFWVIPQRLIYRWLMIIVLFRSFRRAIKGELQHWGVLKRTGNVKEVEA